MIHKPYAACIGNAEECRKMAADLDAIETGILNIYKEHLADGVDIADIQKMVAEETWLNGEEAAKYFTVEVGAAKEYAAKFTDTVSAYAKVPKEIIKSARAADNTAEKTAEKIKRVVIDGISKGV